MQTSAFCLSPIQAEGKLANEEQARVPPSARTNTGLLERLSAGIACPAAGKMVLCAKVSPEDTTCNQGGHAPRQPNPENAVQRK